MFNIFEIAEIKRVININIVLFHIKMQVLRTQSQKKGTILQMFTTKTSKENKRSNENVCIFKIQWKDPSKPKHEDVQYTFIESGEAKFKHPQLIIQFYEKKIKLKEVDQIKGFGKNQAILQQSENGENKILSFLNESESLQQGRQQDRHCIGSLLDYDNIRDYQKQSCRVFFTLAKTRRRIPTKQSSNKQESLKQTNSEKSLKKYIKNKKRSKSHIKNKAIR